MQIRAQICRAIMCTDEIMVSRLCNMQSKWTVFSPSSAGQCKYEQHEESNLNSTPPGDGIVSFYVCFDISGC